LSSDGRTLIFADGLSGQTPAGNATMFRRSTDGSPAVALGEARGGSRLSPDGRWVLAALGKNLILMPVGAGSTVTLPMGEVKAFRPGAWLRDAKRIVFTGDPGDGKPRGYIQEIPAGMPRAFTKEGVVLADNAAVRDDNSILGRVNRTWMLFPLQGGDSRPVPALTPADIPLQWSDDGRYVYTVENVGPARPPAFEVFRVEPATGGRGLWKTLSPSDPVGVEGLRGTLVMTPDARSYCYSYMRRLGDLFVVDGLK
jgi:eukaryotic-like serine/threonine-protein kinase